MRVAIGRLPIERANAFIQEDTMISPTWFGLAFAMPLLITVADVPAYDVSPACRAAVTVMPGSFDACMKDEESARTQLATSWDRFPVLQRDSCVKTENTGGSPSYVELLTCLQMAQDVQNLPANGGNGPKR
jgi:hypothetical protein